jgi:hypothetical protein
MQRTVVACDDRYKRRLFVSKIQTAYAYLSMGQILKIAKGISVLGISGDPRVYR